MNDLEEAAKNLRLLADTVSMLKESMLAEDPEVMRQVERLVIAMSAYNDQLSALDDLCSAPSSAPHSRPPLYLVKT